MGGNIFDYINQNRIYEGYGEEVESLNNDDYIKYTIENKYTNDFVEKMCSDIDVTYYSDDSIKEDNLYMNNDLIYSGKNVFNKYDFYNICNKFLKHIHIFFLDTNFERKNEDLPVQYILLPDYIDKNTNISTITYLLRLLAFVLSNMKTNGYLVLNNNYLDSSKVEDFKNLCKAKNIEIDFDVLLIADYLKKFLIKNYFHEYVWGKHVDINILIKEIIEMNKKYGLHYDNLLERIDIATNEHNIKYFKIMYKKIILPYAPPFFDED